MTIRLNLGCGNDFRRGYINLDRLSIDLNKIPYPFEESSIDRILLLDVLEHLNNPDLVIEELYRICKNKAEIIITVPHFSSIHAWGDLQHKRPFSIRSFWKLPTQKFKVEAKINLPRIYFFLLPIVNNFPTFYEKHLAYIFPANNINVKLKVKK